jgi:hypothetical protein
MITRAQCTLPIPIGTKKIKSKVDAVVSSLGTKFPLSNIAGKPFALEACFSFVLFESKLVQNFEYGHPQVAAHLLSMAMSIYGSRSYSPDPITVQAIEVRGRYFTLWKATFTVEYLSSIVKVYLQIIYTIFYKCYYH